MDSSPSKPHFRIERLYVKEMSCKVPRAPHIFTIPNGTPGNSQPTTQFELQIKHQAITATAYEVVLHITATSKLNESTAFTLDIQQGGIFTIEGHSTQDVAYLLNAYCPNLLYPYAARAVTDASLQVGFPPLLLAPINFDHLYQQQLANEEAAGKENSEGVQKTFGTSADKDSTTIIQ